MGKDLKGKELGVGISQLQDGRYIGRFTSKTGRRVQKYFHKLQECKKWIADAQFKDEHGNALFADSPTADAWFNYWIEEVKGDSIRDATRKRYISHWDILISPVIGEMELKDIKSIHCQNVLNRMNKRYKVSSIQICRNLMKTVFSCAVDNDILVKNPITKSVRPTGGGKVVKREALTMEEQNIFLEAAKKAAHYNEYAFILQTGLRVGELMALRWSDVDFNNKIIHIRHNLHYKKGGGFVLGEPKTESGVRDIPLTKEAIRILLDQKEKNSKNKVVQMEYSDFVFLNKHGKITLVCTYNDGINSICRAKNLKHFSIHTLRHTFATRCIEAGMRPKTLQSILGHSKIEMTMNLYVHVTDDAKTEEMKSAEKKLKLV